MLVHPFPAFYHTTGCCSTYKWTSLRNQLPNRIRSTSVITCRSNTLAHGRYSRNWIKHELLGFKLLWTMSGICGLLSCSRIYIHIYIAIIAYGLSVNPIIACNAQTFFLPLEIRLLKRLLPAAIGSSVSSYNAVAHVSIHILYKKTNVGGITNKYPAKYIHTI